jgi:hypothetical protein
MRRIAKDNRTSVSPMHNEPPAKARIVIESVNSAEKAAVAKC